MNQPTDTDTRKPTKRQWEAIRHAIAMQEDVLFPSTAPRGVLERIQAAGWATEGMRWDSGAWNEYPKITDAGKRAVGRADLIALPDVVVGDVLVYRTHPACAFRVTKVESGGRLFDGYYVTVCADCGGRAPTIKQDTERREVFVHAAYLVRPAHPTDVRSVEFTAVDRERATKGDPAGWSDLDTRLAHDIEPRHPAGTPEHACDRHGDHAGCGFHCPCSGRAASPSIDPAETDIRAEYVASLRALAELLERNTDLDVPYAGGSISVIPLGAEHQRAQVAAWTRALPGVKRKEASGDGAAFYVYGNVGLLRICVIADRNEVCERVVVGTREVVETRPDPDAVAALPTTTVTRVEEIVEWRCSPVLAGTVAQ